jgi:hypothetical protein
VETLNFGAWMVWWKCEEGGDLEMVDGRHRGTAVEEGSRGS